MREKYLSRAHYAVHGDMVMAPRDQGAVRRVLDLVLAARRETAARCAEIADYRVGAAKDIRREFGLEE